MIDPFLGITSPVRLLREQWKDAVALSQELYAMYTAKGPREISGPLTIRVGRGQPALRVIQDEGDTIVNEGPVHNFGVSSTETSTSPAVPGRKPRPTRQDEARRQQKPQSGAQQAAGPGRPDRSGSLSIDTLATYEGVAPVEFSVPTRFSSVATFDMPVFTSMPTVVDRRRGTVQPLDDYVRQALAPSEAQFGGDNSNGSSDSYGVVVSGTGSTWSVQLISNLQTGAVGQTVTVTIPFISSSEVAPTGITVGPIQQISGFYYYQPPVWMG